MSDKKLPPHETWGALLDMALDDEVERVRKLSDAEVDRELAAKGVDPKALRARGDALIARLEKAQQAKQPAPASAPVPAQAPALAPAVAPAPARAPARVIPLRPWLRTALPLAAAAVVLGLLVVRWLGSGEEPIIAHGGPTAAELRQKAVEDCNAKRWRACVDDLDQANRTDPRGGEAPLYQGLRHQAEAALGDALPD